MGTDVEPVLEKMLSLGAAMSRMDDSLQQVRHAAYEGPKCGVALQDHFRRSSCILLVHCFNIKICCAALHGTQEHGENAVSGLRRGPCRAVGLP